MQTIDSFSGENRFLSNFYPAQVVYEGLVYPTTEHAFQAAKTLSRVERIQVENCESPGQAKKMGRKVTLREDWEEVKNEVMYVLCRQKFSAHKGLKDKLLATGDVELIEGNTWNDTYWGVCKGKGENNLGKILMQIREELQSEKS